MRTSLLAWPLLLALAACSSTGPNPNNVDQPRTIERSEEYWRPDVLAGDDTSIVTDSIEIRDTEANAEQEVRDRCLRRAVELACKETLGDSEAFDKNENEIRFGLIDQWQKFVADYSVVERSRFGDGRKLGVKIRVRVAKDKIQSALREKQFLAVDTTRAILVVRKPAANAATVEAGADAYLGDLEELLAKESNGRGIVTQSWHDTALSLAEERDAKDPKTKAFVETFLENSEWRNEARDERYELPLLLLRSRGRLLFGFRFLELTKVELAYHATIRVDAYDLFNGTSLGMWSESDREAIADKTLVETRQVVVERLSRRLMTKMLNEVQTFLDKQRRLARTDLTLRFRGYGAEDTNRIGTLIAGVVAENIAPEQDGEDLAIKIRVARSAVIVRDEIGRNLKRLGLGSKPPQLTSSTILFVKE